MHEESFSLFVIITPPNSAYTCGTTKRLWMPVIMETTTSTYGAAQNTYPTATAAGSYIRVNHSDLRRIASSMCVILASSAHPAAGRLRYAIEWTIGWRGIHHSHKFLLVQLSVSDCDKSRSTPIYAISTWLSRRILVSRSDRYREVSPETRLWGLRRCGTENRVKDFHELVSSGSRGTAIS
jgi:hypothetical protein